VRFGYAAPAFAAALLLGGISLTSAPMAHAAAPTAYADGFAVIGSITLPGAGFLEAPYVSADDTVYIPTQGANYVAVIAPGTTSGSIDDSIAARYPRAVTTSVDDTVFVAEYIDARVAVFAPGTTSPAYRISLPHYPHGLAISPDDTLAVSQYLGSGGDVSLVAPNAGAVAATISGIFGSSNPGQIATDSSGNFYVGSDSTSVKVIPFDGLTVSSTITGLNIPNHPGITSDDTLLVTNRGTNEVGVIPQGDTAPSAFVSVGADPAALTIGPDDKAYVSNYVSGTVSQVDPVTLTSETILSGVTHTHGIAITSQGTLYVTINDSPMMLAVAHEVAATTSANSGTAGDTISLSLTGLPSGTLMDDSTVQAVWWGDDTVDFTREAGSNSVSVTVPSGTGTVPVVAEVHGGRPLSAGNFTYNAAPTPTPAPTFPPTAPQAVIAIAGDASASVAWSAPASRGSFAISTYQVRAAPGGALCLASAQSCEVPGLVNGTTYTFEVRALNGAGWGPWSTSSDPVTPSAQEDPATVVITGSRGEVHGEPGIIVSGTSTGLGMGTILRPWVRLRGQVAFTQGSAEILVSETGTFAWQRRTGKKATVYVETPDGTVRSKRITIQ